jgi:hypothetical protein
VQVATRCGRQLQQLVGRRFRCHLGIGPSSELSEDFVSVLNGEVAFEKGEKRGGFQRIEPLGGPAGPQVIFAVEQHVVQRTLGTDNLGRQPTNQLTVVLASPSVSADLV